MSRTFLSEAHLRTGDQVLCKYTLSSRSSHDKLHRFFVMVLPEVETLRSDEADVVGIARRAHAGPENKSMGRSGHHDAIP